MTINNFAYYSDVMEDYVPSPCPYCGLPRVVKHSYLGYFYEDPHEYVVEHANEREAAEAGCFSMYAAFGSPEKAVEKANIRNGYLQKG